MNPAVRVWIDELKLKVHPELGNLFMSSTPNIAIALPTCRVMFNTRNDEMNDFAVLELRQDVARWFTDFESALYGDPA